MAILEELQSEATAATASAPPPPASASSSAAAAARDAPSSPRATIRQKPPSESAYYYAHHHDDAARADLPAPMPPPNGTKIRPPAAPAAPPRASPPPKSASSAYYYAHEPRRPPRDAARETPAPLPPAGGTLLKREVRDEAPEIPLRGYYFEDNGAAFLTITFKLPGVGAAATATRPRADVRVTFGKKSARGFEIVVTGYYPPGETIADDELRTKTPAVRRFNCVRTFGAVIWDLSSWRTTRDKIILKLRKDAVGVTWRAIM